jgi:hypothetical protein
VRPYEFAHRAGGVKKFWRRAWDLNPRRFPLPVFKTGALGHYASPPWENLPSPAGVYQISLLLLTYPRLFIEAGQSGF